MSLYDDVEREARADRDPLYDDRPEPSDYLDEPTALADRTPYCRYCRSYHHHTFRMCKRPENADRRAEQIAVLRKQWPNYTPD